MNSTNWHKITKQKIEDDWVGDLKKMEHVSYFFDMNERQEEERIYIGFMQAQ